MDKIQKNLEAFLEQKRGEFPRFYFLSNDDLLQILANTQDVKAVERHLNKCFDNIFSLVLVETSGTYDIEGVRSGEGEEMSIKKVNPRSQGSVEKWMLQIE